MIQIKACVLYCVLNYPDADFINSFDIKVMKFHRILF